MKKLMMAAAIVCAAVAAQAATVNWATGTKIKPDGANFAATDTLSIMVFSVGLTEYGNATYDNIWSNYGKEKVADIKAAADYSATGAGAAGVKAEQKDAANGSSTYGIIVMTYDSNLDGKVDMYAVNKFTAKVNDSGSVTASPTNLGKYYGGGTSGTDVKWQSLAVPEPTSGLLLLLGVAGLALRRRRA